MARVVLEPLTLGDVASKIVGARNQLVKRYEDKEKKKKPKLICKNEDMLLCRIQGHPIVNLIPKLTKDYPLLKDKIIVEYVIEGNKQNAITDSKGPIIFEFKKKDWDERIKDQRFQLCKKCKKWMVCRDKSKF